jgi:uncharacterized protein YdaT
MAANQGKELSRQPISDRQPIDINARLPVPVNQYQDFLAGLKDRDISIMQAAERSQNFRAIINDKPELFNDLLDFTAAIIWEIQRFFQLPGLNAENIARIAKSIITNYGRWLNEYDLIVFRDGLIARRFEAANQIYDLPKLYGKLQPDQVFEQLQIYLQAKAQAKLVLARKASEETFQDRKNQSKAPIPEDFKLKAARSIYNKAANDSERKASASRIAEFLNANDREQFRRELINANQGKSIIDSFDEAAKHKSNKEAMQSNLNSQSKNSELNDQRLSNHLNPFDSDE